MANIARLPNGSQVIASTNGIQPYGPRCWTNAVNGQTAAIYDGNPSLPTTKMLALLAVNGDFRIESPNLDALTVPYVNRFLLTTGSVIVKDWRAAQTGNPTYRAKTAKGRRAAKSRAQHTPTAATLPVMATTMVEATPPKAATITVTASAESSTPPVAIGSAHPLAQVPGILFPTGTAKMKGAGKGWTFVDGIIAPTTSVQRLTSGWNLTQKGELGHMVITGPAGTAKTLLVEAYANANGIPLLKVDCSTIRTSDDWAGRYKQDPNTKVWDHQWSPFAQTLRAGVPCIILLDELTRTETPAALNALLSLLDKTGSLSVPDAGVTLRMPKGIMVIATANIGPEFVGTLPLDAAIRQRFLNGVRMDYPSEAIEAKVLTDLGNIDRVTADSLVRMAVQQRTHRMDAERFPSGNIISTRLLLAMAKNMAEGMPHREAIWAVLEAQFDPGDDKALHMVVDTQFPVTPEPSAQAAAAGAATFVMERHYFTASLLTQPCSYLLSNGNRCSRANTDPIHLPR